MHYIFLIIFCTFSTVYAEDQWLTSLKSDEVKVRTNEVKRSGEILYELEAIGLIKQPAEKLWAIISNCKDYHKNMPSILKSRFISKNKDKIRCELTVDLPWPLDNLRSVTDAVHTVIPGKSFKRAWKLVEGDYQVNEGAWILTIKEPNVTLAHYRLLVQPNTNVPAMIRRAAQKSRIPSLFEHLEKIAAK